MRFLKHFLPAQILSLTGMLGAATLPRADVPVAVTLPDCGAELRAFDAPETKPVQWWPHVVNAAWGDGRGGPERNGGWLEQNWEWVDYLDRSADYTTHEWLTHRGIWYEVYNNNEYQETIHFHEEGAKQLFWGNGIARDMNGERVLSEHYNLSVPSWAKDIGWNAYIVCNNAPRWSAVINYDWLTSPLPGFAISQDNIGGPTSRIGAGSHGRYCDFCNAKFFHYLESTGRLPEFRARYRHIRDYVQDNLTDVVRQTRPYVPHRFSPAQAQILAKLAQPPVMSEYMKFLHLSHLHNFVRYYRDAKLVAGQTLLSGDLSRLLWVKPWRHGNDCVSLHFVNYDVDFTNGLAHPTQPVEVTLTLPSGVPAEEAAWLTPAGPPETVAFQTNGSRVTFTIPSVRIYGVMVIGRRGLDAARSRLLDAEARLARATMACEGSWGNLSPQAAEVRQAIHESSRQGAANALAATAHDAARALLRSVQKQADDAYFARLRNAATADGALFAFDFGATKAKPPWKPVQASSTYSPPTGFGWLPAEDTTDPTPEELYYSMAQKYGAKYRGPEPAAQSLLFWPYRQPIPAPLRMSLSSGASRTFRVNAPPGAYRVRVITTHPAWMNRNFLVSGMVSVNGAVQLLDALHDRGAVVSREFTVKTTSDHLEFTLGGPTGWAVAALIIGRETNPNPDAQLAGSVRTWHLSPRFANAAWYPIAQVSAPPESRLDRLPEATWTRAAAPAGGLPVIDLGSNRESDIGDVVYAATTIESPTARPVRLHVGASSSAQVWLNGEPIGYVPNEKGVRLDEFVAPVSLCSGRNLLVVKLQRFWERRWLFYARLSTPG